MQAKEWDKNETINPFLIGVKLRDKGKAKHPNNSHHLETGFSVIHCQSRMKHLWLMAQTSLSISTLVHPPAHPTFAHASVLSISFPLKKGHWSSLLRTRSLAPSLPWTPASLLPRLRQKPTTSLHPKPLLFWGTYRSHPRSLSLPVSLQSRPPHFIQSDREDPSVESHHSSSQNLLKLSRHCPREPMSLTETCGPPHPCSPSAVPQPLSTGFGTSS